MLQQRVFGRCDPAIRTALLLLSLMLPLLLLQRSGCLQSISHLASRRGHASAVGGGRHLALLPPLRCRRLLRLQLALLLLLRPLLRRQPRANSHRGASQSREAPPPAGSSRSISQQPAVGTARRRHCRRPTGSHGAVQLTPLQEVGRQLGSNLKLQLLCLGVPAAPAAREGSGA